MRAVIAVVFAGCWTSAQPPVSGPSAPAVEPPAAAIAMWRPRPYHSPCESAIDHVIELSRDDIDKLPDMADKIAAIRDAGVESCNATHWSDEILECFDDAAETSALSRCQNLLTSDQTTDMMKRVTEVLTAPAPATP